MYLTPMRKRENDDTWATYHILRPLVWAIWQFGEEARAIRKYRKDHGYD